MALKISAVYLVLFASLGVYADAHPYFTKPENVELNQDEGVEVQDSGFVSVYLFDPSNGKYLSRIYRNGWESIEAAKSAPDVACQFKMYVLENINALAFQADNGKYLGRVLYGDSAYSEDNYIQANKSDADSVSQFQYWFQFATPPAGRPKSIGKIALRSDNGRYWVRRNDNGVDFIKPLSVNPVFYELIIAE